MFVELWTNRTKCPLCRRDAAQVMQLCTSVCVDTVPAEDTEEAPSSVNATRRGHDGESDDNGEESSDEDDDDEGQGAGLAALARVFGHRVPNDDVLGHSRFADSADSSPWWVTARFS